MASHIKGVLAMKTVPVREAKNRFSELLAAVEQGETVCITRRGVAVARLVAAPSPASDAARLAARRRMAESLARLSRWRRHLSLDGDLKLIAREGADGCHS
jgi:prevent-host-death family protein